MTRRRQCFDLRQQLREARFEARELLRLWRKGPSSERAWEWKQAQRHAVVLMDEYNRCMEREDR